MKKSINQKTKPAENHIFSDLAHDHFATCDFMAGMIYHYYDPESPSEQKLLSAQKIKAHEADKNIEELAKKQFNKSFRATTLDLGTSAFSKILDIKRGTSTSTKKDILIAELQKKIDEFSSIVNSVEVSGIVKINFSTAYLYLSILLDSNNEALGWALKAQEKGEEFSERIVKSLKTKIKEDLLDLSEINYALDIEGFLHEIDELDNPVIGGQSSFKLTKSVYHEVYYQLPPEKQSELEEWCKIHAT
jgi:predicted transcriptional regulator